ncbi:hypothetical protein ACO1MO_13675, partial [Staphylococcus aureus]
LSPDERKELYYTAELDALAEQVNTLRQLHESAFNDPKSDAQEVKGLNDTYVEANSVLIERLNAGEKFADNRSSRAALTELYMAMDLSKLG